MITVLTLSDWVGILFLGIFLLLSAFVFTLLLIEYLEKKIKHILKRTSAGGSE